MSQQTIRVPDLGEGIAEVELVAWHVNVGDAVAEDQVLAEMMTDKATVEIPSSVAGKVIALGGDVGQVMAVGATLITIDGDGDGEAKVEVEADRPEPPPPVAGPRSVRSAAPTPSPPAPSPAAARQRPIASPAVRARAWELGIDLAQVRGSGTAGRIMQVDLDAHGSRARPRAAASTTAPPADETERIIGLRRKIAERMQDSKRRIPHFSYVEEIDVTDLEALRATLNVKHATARGHLTLLPFIVRAIVLAIGDYAQVNAHLDDEAGVLKRFGAVHIGLATQTDAGLMVPVLRDAQRRDLWAIAGEITRLADAARSGKIVRDELTGSTITVTSLGKLGGIVSTLVINRPEVAIVGVNRIVERPMWRAGTVVPRRMMNLSSSFDHRVVDGQVAAGFIQQVRATLEEPALLFID